MGEHQLVLFRHGGQRGGGGTHVGALVVGRHRLPALEEGIASQRHDYPHRLLAQSPSVATMMALIVWQAVRPVEDDPALGLEDVVGDLEAVHPELLEDVLAHLGLPVVEGRQAVHELDRRVAGPGDHVAVHLVGREELDPLRPDALVLAHRHPDVGVEVVHPGDPFVDVLGQRQPGAGLLGDRAAGRDQVVLRPQVAGAHSRTSMPYLQAPTISELPMLLRASPR